MKDVELVCWKCGASLHELPLPLGRYAECLACHAELHVCRLCRFYDTAVAKACRELVAEEVKDKERANFCGYFEPRPDAYQAADQAAAMAAREALEAMFGPTQAPAEPDEPASPSAADAARAQLDELFGKRGED